MHISLVFLAFALRLRIGTPMLPGAVMSEQKRNYNTYVFQNYCKQSVVLVSHAIHPKTRHTFLPPLTHTAKIYTNGPAFGARLGSRLAATPVL